MFQEAIRFLSGKQTEGQRAANIERVHPVSNRTTMLYLLSRTGPLSHSQIDILATTLYENLDQPINTLPEVYKKSDLPTKTKLEEDPFLKHVVLEYPEKDMADTILVTPEWRSRHFALAELWGKARPILEDLHWLHSFGEVRIREMQDGQRIYSTTHSGDALTKAISIIYSNLDLPEDVLIKPERQPAGVWKFFGADEKF